MADGANFDFFVFHAIAAIAAVEFYGITPANYHKQNASNGADWKILCGQARQNTNGLNGRANASKFGFFLYCRGRSFDWPLWRGRNGRHGGNWRPIDAQAEILSALRTRRNPASAFNFKFNLLSATRAGARGDHKLVFPVLRRCNQSRDSHWKQGDLPASKHVDHHSHPGPLASCNFSPHYCNAQTGQPDVQVRFPVSNNLRRDPNAGQGPGGPPKAQLAGFRSKVSGRFDVVHQVLGGLHVQNVLAADCYCTTWRATATGQGLE